MAKRHGIACLLERLGLSAQLEPGSADLHITGIAFDSREVRPGYAFVCIVGEHVDGNQYIPEAVSRGAACIFSERKAPACAIPYFQVADVRQLLAELAADFYGQPSLKLRVLGVTGTNGKTTTTHLVDYILNYAGLKSGLIGTLGARLPGFDVYQNVKHTTPQSSDLYNSLAQMAESGCSHVCMEVSSHALSQKRVAGCHFASACLTNITQDHLDFHQTMENYWQSKRLLFSQLNDSRQQNKSAVINLDEPLAPEFLKVLNSEVKPLTYSWNKDSDLSVLKAEFGFKGSNLLLRGRQGQFNLKTRLTGQFNVYNIMAALLTCQAEGVSLDIAGKALEGFGGVPGRFETVSAGFSGEPLCIVDYAHTPDGLENVLKAARHLLPENGKLIVVFGCGGDRDTSKRPQMGEIAEALGDQVIVTSDNPRSENPEQIIANILAGINKIHKVKVEVDRASAISLAIDAASADDVVLVAGKGHENYQILADKTIPFDDRTEVVLALKEKLG